MRRSNPRRAFFLVVAAVIVVSTACRVGDHSCLRNSECENSYACVDGTCRSDETLPSSAGGGETPADGGTVTVTVADAAPDA